MSPAAPPPPGADLLSTDRAHQRALVVMLLVGALGALVGAVAPMTDQAPVTLNASLAAVGVVLAVVVSRAVGPVWLHVGALAVVGGTTSVVAVAATPQGAAGTAISCLWVPVYAAFVFSRRTAWLYVALVAVALAAALVSNPFPGSAHVWFLVALTSAAASGAVGSLVERLRRQAMVDPLTGLLNRTGLHQLAEPALALADRSGRALTVVAIDLDDFKAVNDSHGHAAGDDVLVGLARDWSTALRAQDVAARVGGDEFVLVLPDTDAAGATTLVDRLRDTSSTPWSYGLSHHRPGRRLGDLLRDADRQLYAAKRAGGRQADAVDVAVPRRRRPFPEGLLST